MKKKNKHADKNIDLLRLILLICVVLFHYGLPKTSAVSNIRYVLGFAVPAVFIVSGYLVLNGDGSRGKRITRTMLRSGLCFLILTLCNFAFSYVMSPEVTLLAIRSKQFWINFLLFNEWQLPPTIMIWYVQAFFYAYVIIFLLEKLRLLKFDWLICAVLLLISSIFGEFAGIFKFSLLGHSYISANFFSRALPFILLGGIIAKNKEKLFQFPKYQYILLALAGIVLTCAEYEILNRSGLLIYTAHYIGNTVTAVAVCGIVFTLEKQISIFSLEYLNRWVINAAFYVYPFLYYFFMRLFNQMWFSALLALMLAFTIIPVYEIICRIDHRKYPG